MALIPKAVFIFTFASLPFLVSYLSSVNYFYHWCGSWWQQDYDGQVFDYIVIGSGSAGAPLAHRISAQSKVILLEAGGDPQWLHSVPALFLALMNEPSTDWGHETVLQRHGGLLVERQVTKWPRGKMLGGTSMVNGMMYVRGHPRDYDNWANLTGDPNWSYENVLPAFRASLDYGGDFSENRKHYGSSSPYARFRVEPSFRNPLYETWIGAGREMGFQERDLNGPQASGFGRCEVSMKQGVRSSTYSAFLAPAHLRDRPNLHISKYSQAVKIHLDRHNRARGVWFMQHGVRKYVRARREIVVSAGAIDSPKLLMLSGIGPAAHLQSVGIRPRVDLPVGKSLQDHLNAVLFNVLIDKPLSFVSSRDFGLWTWVEYLWAGTGLLSRSFQAIIGQGFICSPTPSGVNTSTSTGCEWPNIQVYALSQGMSDTAHLDYGLGYGWNVSIIEEFLSQSLGKDAVNFISILGRPKSRGEILLRDKDPKSPLLIDPHYLEHPEDVKAVVRALQFSARLVQTESFKKIGTRILPTPLPPCKHLKFLSDAYSECYARQVASTTFHPVGTCRMGRTSDPRTVVDSKLRVKGVHGLRVADASIMPVIVNGNTNAPVIMIGEKAAEFVRQFWADQFEICDRFAYVFHQRLAKYLCFYSQLV